MKWRTGFIFALFSFSFVCLIIKIGIICADEEILTVGKNQGTKTVTVSTVRGTIYDRNGEKLVNNTYNYVAAFMPEQSLFETIRPAVSTEIYHQLLEAGKSRMPLSVKLNKAIAETTGLHVLRTTTRYTKGFCTHLIGYLGGNNQGVSGLEKAFNDTLTDNSGLLTVTFPVNGTGNHLATLNSWVTDTTANSRGGIVTTLDKDIQITIDEVANSTFSKGAVVILSTDGNLLAMSSRPNYDPLDVDESFETTDGALINRALSRYDCGSIFKIVTVAAALEYGISENQGYLCSGEMMVGSTIFHCHNRQGHNLVNMEDAFAKSCNLYFIQLAQEIGGEQILKTAEKLGFAEEIVLADELIAPAALLPTKELLETPAALANLSFGQGELLVSPLHVARMTALFTANGTLPQISTIIGMLSKNGTLTQIKTGAGETVLSAANTRKLCHMLECVVTEGTGTAAQPIYTTAAGKTGTAETGQLDDTGVPITQSWFTGYYPADNPRYVITVLVEDAGNNDYTAAKVFCEISNKLEQNRRNGE